MSKNLSLQKGINLSLSSPFQFTFISTLSSQKKKKNNIFTPKNSKSQSNEIFSSANYHRYHQLLTIMTNTKGNSSHSQTEPGLLDFSVKMQPGNAWFADESDLKEERAHIWKSHVLIPHSNSSHAYLGPIEKSESEERPLISTYRNKNRFLRSVHLSRSYVFWNTSILSPISTKRVYSVDQSIHFDLFKILANHIVFVILQKSMNVLNKQMQITIEIQRRSNLSRLL